MITDVITFGHYNYGPTEGVLQYYGKPHYFYWSDDTESGISLYNIVKLRSYEMAYERFRERLFLKAYHQPESKKKRLMCTLWLALPHFHYDNRDIVTTITDEQLLFGKLG